MNNTKTLDIALMLILVPFIVLFLGTKAYWKELLAGGFFIAWAYVTFAKRG